MRIVGGTLKGRRFNPASALPVRPTTDMAKEGLFNILRNLVDFEDVVVLDLFSGTGNIGFEFISRGAKHVTMVEKNPKSVAFISQTAKAFEISNLSVLQADVFAFLGRVKAGYDIVFADPPYDLSQISLLPKLICGQSVLKEGGLFILEHPQTYHFEEYPYFQQQRRYGKVNFSFFHKV